MIGLQGVVMLGRDDHGIELARLLYEHRFALGVGRKTTESVLGFSGSDSHEGLQKCLAILANDLSARQAKSLESRRLTSQILRITLEIQMIA
jgi:hypothetical protein